MRNALQKQIDEMMGSKQENGSTEATKDDINKANQKIKSLQ